MSKFICASQGWCQTASGRRRISSGATGIGRHAQQCGSQHRKQVSLEGILRRSPGRRHTLQRLAAAVRATKDLVYKCTLRSGRESVRRVDINASAAKSIIEREGFLKARCIDVNVWLQEQGERRRLPLPKMLGTMNRANLMTKKQQLQDINKFLALLNRRCLAGRSDLAAELYTMPLF